MGKPADRFTVLCTTLGCVVLFGALGSTLIVLIALMKFTNITDPGMFAIAAMAAAPAALGIGVAVFLYLAFMVETKRSGDSFDHGAADQFIRRIDRPDSP